MRKSDLTRRKHCWKSCAHDVAAVEQALGGDMLELQRRMWNPETLEEHALEWELYERFARAASSAAGAPQ